MFARASVTSDQHVPAFALPLRDPPPPAPARRAQGGRDHAQQLLHPPVEAGEGRPEQPRAEHGDVRVQQLAEPHPRPRQPPLAGSSTHWLSTVAPGRAISSGQLRRSPGAKATRTPDQLRRRAALRPGAAPGPRAVRWPRAEIAQLQAGGMAQKHVGVGRVGRRSVEPGGRQLQPSGGGQLQVLAAHLPKAPRSDPRRQEIEVVGGPGHIHHRRRADIPGGGVQLLDPRAEQVLRGRDVLAGHGVGLHPRPDPAAGDEALRQQYAGDRQQGQADQHLHQGEAVVPPRFHVEGARRSERRLTRVRPCGGATSTNTVISRPDPPGADGAGDTSTRQAISPSAPLDSPGARAMSPPTSARRGLRL